MKPHEVFRLDVAIETQENVVNLYKEFLKSNKAVTFKDIMLNYLRLEDFESGDDKRLLEFFNATVYESINPKVNTTKP